MKTVLDQLAGYGAYHRDRRNIATHLIGVPMIVFAVVVLLARPGFMVAGLTVTPALVALVMTGIYYLLLDVALGGNVVIVDVREPQEYQINRIPGSILMPLGDLPKRYVELDPNAAIVTQCKSGMRSAKAQEFLRSKGFTNVRNLTGGILGWIDQVDPSQPKY